MIIIIKYFDANPSQVSITVKCINFCGDLTVYDSKTCYLQATAQPDPGTYTFRGLFGVSGSTNLRHEC